MAYGPTITLTHAGASTNPILISDIRDRTDGPAYAASNPAGGGVYVPVGGTRVLPYTSDVARSYEAGAIRSFVDTSQITVAWTHGTEFADANSQDKLYTATLTNTATDAFYWVAPFDLKVLSIKVFAHVVPVNAGTYTLAVAGGGNNLLGAATFDMEAIAAPDVAQDLTLTTTTANLTLDEDDFVSITLAASGAFSAGSGVIVVVEYAHR